MLRVKPLSNHIS